MPRIYMYIHSIYYIYNEFNLKGMFFLSNILCFFSAVFNFLKMEVSSLKLLCFIYTFTDVYSVTYGHYNGEMGQYFYNGELSGINNKGTKEGNRDGNYGGNNDWYSMYKYNDRRRQERNKNKGYDGEKDTNTNGNPKSIFSNDFLNKYGAHGEYKYDGMYVYI